MLRIQLDERHPYLLSQSPSKSGLARARRSHHDDAARSYVMARRRRIRNHSQVTHYVSLNHPSASCLIRQARAWHAAVCGPGQGTVGNPGWTGWQPLGGTVAVGDWARLPAPGTLTWSEGSRSAMPRSPDML